VLTTRALSPVHLQDLKLLMARGMIKKGAYVVGDNLLIPGEKLRGLISHWRDNQASVYFSLATHTHTHPLL